jgi:outer membrane protein OmpA-like peptidoglycan-associated protein
MTKFSNWISKASGFFLLAFLFPMITFSQVIQSLSGANSPQDDMNPVWIGNNTLLFTRAFHPKNIGGTTDPGDIWMTQRGDDGIWQEAVHRADLSRSGYDFALGLENVLTLLVYHQEGSAVGLYQYSKFGMDWNFLRKVNLPGLEDLKGQVSGRIATGGKQIFLSGKGADSKGNEDLYFSEKVGVIDWSSPINLGGNLNTAGQEMSPFFDISSQNLYFSSNMLPGANGKDIYISKRMGEGFNSWSKPVKWEQLSSNGSDISVTFISPTEVIWTSTQNSDGFADLLSFGDTVKLDIPTEFDLLSVSQSLPQPPKIAPAKTEKSVTIVPIYPLSAIGIPEIKMVDSNTEMEKAVSWFVIDAKNKVEVPFTLSWVTGDKSFQADVNSLVKISQLKESNVKEIKVIAKGYFPTLIPIESLKNNEPTVVLMTKAESGNRVVLEDVNFKRGTAELEGAETIRSLTEIADFLLENPELRLRIHGHTDNAGDPSLNKALSLDRASSVRTFFTDKGIQFENLRISGWGGTRPVASNSTESGRSKNRRVELEVEY